MSMTATLDRFMSALSICGALSVDELVELQQQLDVAHAPQTVRELAERLVREQRLTLFQARAFLRGRSAELMLNEYLLVDRIGAGGMGQVFKARHRRMKRTVAIKTLPALAVDSVEAVERFQREVEAAARLEHPNIVTAYDAGECGDIHFLVMQHIAGPNLAQYVRRRGALPLAQALNVVLQAARGLEYAHRQGVIHRDVKPGNLLLAPDGTVKILDMGLARFAGGASAVTASRATLTGAGQVMGTVDFMAPEQAEDLRAADERADVYSLGSTLFYLLAGQVMYEEGSAVTRLLKHREAPIPRLCQVAPNVSPRVDELYQRMVAKSPDDRFASMQEVIEAVERLAGELQIDVESARLLPGNADDFLPQQADDPFGETLTSQQETTDRPPEELASLGATSADSPGRQQTPRSPLQGVLLAGGVAAAVVVVGLAAWFSLSARLHSAPSRDAPSGAAPNGAAPSGAAPNRGDSAPPVQVAGVPPLQVTAAKQVVPDGQAALLDDHDGPVLDVAVSPDGRLLASASADKSLCVYDTSNFGQVYRMRDEIAPFNCVIFTIDGEHLITGSGPGLFEHRNIRFWTSRTGRPEMRVVGRESGTISLDGSPDGRMLVSTHAGGIADLKLIESIGNSAALLSHDQSAECWDADFSSDSRLVATAGGDGKLFVWNVGGDAPKGYSDTFVGPVLIRSVCFSPDDSRIVAGSSDGTIKIWNRWDTPKAWQLERELVGHEGQVVSLAFSRDGRWLASGSHDGTVRVWDAVTWELHQVFAGHTSEVNAVVFLADSLRVASAGSDAAVRIWQIDAQP